jgi:hypothetical protein
MQKFQLFEIQFLCTTLLFGRTSYKKQQYTLMFNKNSDNENNEKSFFIFCRLMPYCRL